MPHAGAQDPHRDPPPRVLHTLEGATSSSAAQRPRNSPQLAANRSSSWQRLRSGVPLPGYLRLRDTAQAASHPSGRHRRTDPRLAPDQPICSPKEVGDATSGPGRQRAARIRVPARRPRAREAHTAGRSASVFVARLWPSSRSSYRQMDRLTSITRSGRLASPQRSPITSPRLSPVDSATRKRFGLRVEA
jgi:hypothetical protein